jgi:hypothetical protein
MKEERKTLNQYLLGIGEVSLNLRAYGSEIDAGRAFLDDSKKSQT